ncbi:MAG: hypothetical protein ACXADY_10675 [Candidatus Hodarchaeales archaeon]|jgi:hypothetical protein
MLIRNIYEQIVKEYYELIGYITRSDIVGPKNREIDLLGIKYLKKDNDYDVVWVEVSGSGGIYSKEECSKKFHPELESLAIELTGKTPRKIFIVYNLADESVCNEIKEELGISMMTLEDVLKDFIQLARENVRKKQPSYPFSPALPIRSFLQSMVDMELKL